MLCSAMHAVGVEHQLRCVLLMALHADCGRLKRNEGMQGPRPAYSHRDDCIITTSLAMLRVLACCHETAQHATEPPVQSAD